MKLKKNYFSSGKFIALKQLLNNLNYLEDDEVSCFDNKNKILLFTRCNNTVELLLNFFKDVFKFVKVTTLKREMSLEER